MFEAPRLSEAEWALIVELLDWESRDLPTEIHHSRVGGVREDLHRRLDMIQSMLERLRPMAGAAPASREEHVGV
ncbi:MAG: hypothetical protein ACYC35_08755 [Pirellulales bacterium]